MNGSTFAAPLTTYLGGQTLNGAYRSTTGTINNGNISVTFSDATHGVITWPNGSTTAIERFNIVPNGVNSVSSANTPQTGWWWNTAEPGRGFAFEIQNGTMFMAGYMYDDSGNPVWYVSGPTPMTNTLYFTGKWQQYGNGQTLTGTYKSPSIVNANVGNVTVAFKDAATATLTLPNGSSIQIERFAFDPAAVPNYAGYYSGTFSGDDSGTFNVTISKAGVISGTYTSNVYGYTGSAYGTIVAGGAMSMTVGGQAGNATFSGKIDVGTGAVSGTWSSSYSGQHGSYTGHKTAALSSSTSPTRSVSQGGPVRK
jgi:hypothetical protein